MRATPPCWRRASWPGSSGPGAARGAAAASSRRSLCECARCARVLHLPHQGVVDAALAGPGLARAADPPLRARVGAVIERYTRPEIGAVWTDAARMEAWRRVEVAACEEMPGPTP